MRISDWSSDVCSSDVCSIATEPRSAATSAGVYGRSILSNRWGGAGTRSSKVIVASFTNHAESTAGTATKWRKWRSEEHTSELQSLMRISYAVFCLKKKKTKNTKKIREIIKNT